MAANTATMMRMMIRIRGTTMAATVLPLLSSEEVLAPVSGFLLPVVSEKI